MTKRLALALFRQMQR